MNSGEVVVSICYGPVASVAVLTGAGGAWVPIRVDGQARLSNAAFLGPDGQWLVGAAAWQAGMAAPARLVTSPVQWFRPGTLTVDGVTADPVNIAATTLRRVVQTAASQLGGDPVSGVRLVVPAGWGPRRRTQLLEAAKQAGLPVPVLVDAPAAVAEHLVSSGVRVLVGAFVAVCDLDWGEVSVLRRTPHGFQVLSTIDAPDVGEQVVDAQLVGWLQSLTPASTTAGEPSGASAQESTRAPDVAAPGTVAWWLSAQAGREALATSPTVTVAAPGGSPVVMHAGWLSQAVEPVAQRAGQTLVKAVEAAELSADQVGGVWVCGALASAPQLPDLIARSAGVPVHPVADPVFAAVRGAANTVGPPADAVGDGADAAPMPGWARVFSVGVPGLVSLLLLIQFSATASIAGTTVGIRRTGYLIANWGELALAGLFALLGLVDTATVIASALPPADPLAPAPRRRWDAQQIGTAILAATAAGLSVAAVYAAFGSVAVGWPISPFLRWALLPLLPVGGLLAVAAALASRLGRVPAGGWHQWLRYPVMSVLLVGAGMLLVQFGLTLSVTADQQTAVAVVVHLGAALFGASFAWILASRPVSRLIVGVPAVLIVTILVGADTTTTLATAYLAAVWWWWARRVWELASRPAGALRPTR